MEEMLKQILTKLEKLDKIDHSIVVLSERLDAHDRSNKEEFRKLDKKLDSITEVVAKTMEDVSGLKTQVEKQDFELKVLAGGK